MTLKPPVLYSFRRCPYAMRARLAIVSACINVELREVLLRNKPPQLLAISSKATVPVLQLNEGRVIDESLDIMYWALSINDPDHWLNTSYMNDIRSLIQQNDNEFKFYLDRYKYSDRYPEQSEQFYRQKAELFIIKLEQRLSQQSFLCSDNPCLADMAIFPFIRQFASVNNDWFQSSPYPYLQQWLNYHLQSSLFSAIMNKYPAWQAGDNTVYFKII